MNDSQKPRRDTRRRNEERPGTLRTIAARVHAAGSSSLRTISIRGFRLNSGEGDHVAGFDLGPSPEEHFIGAIAASLVQAAATVSCARGVHVHSIDVQIEAELSLTPEGGRFETIALEIEFESDEPAASFAGVEADILAASPLANAINIPVELRITGRPRRPERLSSDDWQI